MALAELGELGLRRGHSGEGRRRFTPRCEKPIEVMDTEATDCRSAESDLAPVE
ncbi:Hypothetical protein SMAX5B_015439 [Scophthalmus maximus]|uniref:Uncharacterized protein n=1 Tax=Scophthalmus maximus TaxID=52904 RepID=A0A2U9BXW0_SCOMX|nr:Hypothetical protein SMAX5B_015439 [Scophthalmus maximus]